jgi:hypothetical protein
MRNLSVSWALAVVLFGGLLSSWGPLTRGLPALLSWASRTAGMYDSYFPEITIRDGKLSASNERPFSLHAFGAPNTALVIDTRETNLESLLANLDGASRGVVITKDAAVAKVGRQIRILPLPELPDMVLNSNLLEKFVKERSARLAKPLAALIVVCCVALTLLQASLLTLIAYFAGRAPSLPLNWKESLKEASFALIPPTALEFLMNISGSRLPMSSVVRLLLSAVALALFIAYRRKYCHSGPGHIK